MLYVQDLPNFQYFQNFASICVYNSVKILANPYTETMLLLIFTGQGKKQRLYILYSHIPVFNLAYILYAKWPCMNIVNGNQQVTVKWHPSYHSLWHCVSKLTNRATWTSNACKVETTSAIDTINYNLCTHFHLSII